MALCVNACAGDLLNHTLNSCSSTRLGDIRSAAFILCKEVFEEIAADPEDRSSWLSLTDPAVNVNNANGTFINDVQIERTSEISSVERFVSDGQENQKDGTNYTITITDQNVSCLNHAFYDSLDGRAAYVALFYNDGRMEISETPFTFYTSMPSATKNTVQTYLIEATKKFPVGKSWICVEDAPSGLPINF